MLTQIKNFILHLRLHYQFLILSGGYLLAAIYLTETDRYSFWTQFLNVHILLFGGATAYNSYWDKDEGPIGGLKNPPPMQKWMWALSLFMQFIGLLWGWYTVGTSFALIYSVSMLLFWLYSTPHARWKGHPWLSVIAIGGSTGTNSFLMGILAGGGSLGLNEGLTALGVACLILSLYPVSQVYQYEEDEKREDRTFALKYGLPGVRTFFMLMFVSGSLLVSFFLFQQKEVYGISFGVVSLPALGLITILLYRLKGEMAEYGLVMKLKFIASLSFVIFILSVLLLQSINW
ncbi:UbiA family prenyltransferase [Balneola sp. MJW-20]|uniref:UbiA family prenyltransferase n=1 Tax=Gracilimonas aurantiaca TaxID=3234185 RepID=UPI0034650906